MCLVCSPQGSYDGTKISVQTTQPSKTNTNAEYSVRWKSGLEVVVLLGAWVANDLLLVSSFQESSQDRQVGAVAMFHLVYQGWRSWK